MAQFYKPKAKSAQKKIVRNVSVEALDHHLRGVVKVSGQTLFVQGGLPGEQIDLTIESKHQARLLKRHSSHSLRCEPKCRYFGLCGGCQNQYWPLSNQLESKAKGVEQLLNKLGGYGELDAPQLIRGSEWGYRRITRLSTWYDGKQGWQLGYRQRGSKKLVPITGCPILTPALQSLLLPLHQLLYKFSKSSGLGHIELIDCEPQPVVRIRLLKPLSSDLYQCCTEFSKEQGVALVASSEKDEWINGSHCYYNIDGCQLNFSPGNFIQVNADVNRQMVELAMQWLDPQPDETILDLYCGVGNFTLPLANRCQKVLAIEGVAAMIDCLEQNAQKNALTNVDAITADLDSSDAQALWRDQRIDKVLLDPARSGAKTVITAVARARPKAVVYVACDPATLARDAALMKQAGYRLIRWAVMDMFPYTEHVETMVLFHR